jgi:tRNA A37 threonylcarbamoyladenosine dehydratase
VQSDYETRFSGIRRLYGDAAVQRLRTSHVAVIGVGGVGSWAVEALARTGIGKLTLIDLDEVCVSNVNRQLPALTQAVGKPKVTVMRERVLEINPECEVRPVEEFFTSSSARQLMDDSFDCVFDAIDTVPNKCLLLARCREMGIPVLTAGAAGGRSDPTAVRITDLSACTHDRLLQRVRKILRGKYGFPAAGAKFGIEAVYSPEPPVFPKPDGTICETREGGDMRLNCDTGFGTASFVTGAFAFAATARIVRKLIEDPRE